MIQQDNSALEVAIEQSQAACEALTAEEDTLKREILTHAGNRWSLGVIHALGVAGQPMRHAELARQLGAVTQRMLTRTLRQLERDGLIARRDFGEVPPRVDYRLTSLGEGMLIGMIPLWEWVMASGEEFRRARAAFDDGTTGRSNADGSQNGIHSKGIRNSGMR